LSRDRSSLRGGKGFGLVVCAVWEVSPFTVGRSPSARGKTAGGCRRRAQRGKPCPGCYRHGTVNGETWTATELWPERDIKLAGA